MIPGPTLFRAGALLAALALVPVFWPQLALYWWAHLPGRVISISLLYTLA